MSRLNRIKNLLRRPRETPESRALRVILADLDDVDDYVLIRGEGTAQERCWCPLHNCWHYRKHMLHQRGWVR